MGREGEGRPQHRGFLRFARGLANRRALEAEKLAGSYSLIELDLEGHAPKGRLSVSLGVSTQSPQLTSDFSQVMGLADQAPYAAKGAGRDRVSAADSPAAGSRQDGAPPGANHPGVPSRSGLSFTAARDPGASTTPVIATTDHSGSRRLAP